MGSGYGKIFRLTSFGESHGPAIGGVIDGVPAGFEIDLNAVQALLDRRKPGQSAIVTQRKENDRVVFLSGIFEGKTTGAPIGFMVENTNQRSDDYDHLKNTFRPSHADFTYDQKYKHRDYRGGGRSSARETIARVVAGAIAIQVLAQVGVQFAAFVDQVGELRWFGEWHSDFISVRDANPVRVPNAELAEAMETLIRAVRSEGDTIGGCIRCVIQGVPVGLGEPVFDKLHAELGKAMLSINAVKGFEIGSGFNAVTMRGSAHNDAFIAGGTTKTNHSGGIQGGISNGMPIDFRVAFKPVATLLREQEGMTSDLELETIQGKGRHDACVVPRAVPIVEAMAAMVILDFWLRNQAMQFNG
jgi:chorismate synthase